MIKYKLYSGLDSKEEFQYVVVATSFESPLTEYKEIAKKLDTNDFVGYVLFDMLAYSGDNSERFYKVYFTEGNFDFSTLKYIPFPKKSVYRKKTQTILGSGEFELDNTVLNYIQKNMIQSDMSF